MARPLRLEFDGALYHVTFRGVERRQLFRGDADRERILTKLAEGVERFDLDVYLYCLMSNHVHLLLGTPRGNLSRFMGWWLTAYTVYFNRRHSRSGHLTQGRYGAKLVEGDEYLLALSRYIHLNPIHTKAWEQKPLCERLGELRSYRWSSYAGYGAARKAEPFVRYEPLLRLVGHGRKNPRPAYRRFVEKGVEVAAEEWQSLQSQSRLAVGSPEFIQQTEERYERRVEGSRRLEDVSLRRVARNADPLHVLGMVAERFGISVDTLKRRRRNALDRSVAAYLLVVCSGLSQREAASFLNVSSGVAIGAQLKKCQEEKKANREMRVMIDELEAAFNTRTG